MSKKNPKPIEKAGAQKEEDNQIVIINNIQPPTDDSSLRTINLYGDITESKAEETVNGLLFLESTSQKLIYPENEEEEPYAINRPINLYVSTHGGIASDMFSIIDVMKSIEKKTCDVKTYGIGKVMSAGVLILAAGTKGSRYVGENCRIMLHNVMAGSSGTIFTLENELEEIKWIQERYIHCLAKYTKLTKTRIKKMLKDQRDVYISAEDAIKYGIVDEII